MNRQYVTRGIILSRTDFGEADRIITFLTPDRGKVRAMAKGVRKSRSKLAGGIELFSVSDLTLIIGRGEVNTLISTRLVKHYANIVKDVDRTNTGYEFIRLLNKATEDQLEPDYFDLLVNAFGALDDTSLPPELTFLWLQLQLLKTAGHAPNLKQDTNGKPLAAGGSYDFHLDAMRFAPPANGRQGQYDANHIKFLRLALPAARPAVLAKINGALELSDYLRSLVHSMLAAHVRI